MRRALLALLVCGALLSGSSVAVQAAPGPVVVRGYSYGPHPRQTVTVYGTKGPALVILHGGFWADDTDWSDWASWFAERGFRVYDTDYRLNSDAPWDAQREDALAALRWVADRNGGDRPLLLGSSAGGQIATVAATYGAGATRVRGVVALSPVATPFRAWVDGAREDADEHQRRLRREARRLAGCDPEHEGRRCWLRWADMAARTHASGEQDAPLFLVHSAEDFVPASHSHDLAVAQSVAGSTDTRTRIVLGDAHGARLLDDSGVRRSVLRWLRAHA
ncbi:alpha/beta hydrolase family protein [Streptomyces cavernicola]|uniref:Alpha/beta hydrolase n=1 Tax=Streptomyces cavernicola TaxID=3043613 RepID=A0ABT6SMF8_9ACTN|nr:alpha/beta hydrolase [Streptomyces sp. B-S-A6]MDI3409155.1 alpha/beta hydrolase [Streptomyces sp. B-S-A6]